MAKLVGLEPLRAATHLSGQLLRVQIDLTAHAVINASVIPKRARLFGWLVERRFIVVRERVRKDKEAVGRKLLDVPGYWLRIWVTNRSEPVLELWRDYNGRACVKPCKGTPYFP